MEFKIVEYFLKNAEPYVGRKFNMLTILSFSRVKEFIGKKIKRLAMVSVRCDCGNEKEMILRNVIEGKSKCCGCVGNEKTAKRSTKHGFATRNGWTREHKIWCGMMKRCYNKKEKCYGKYGGAGIIVCERWHDFKNFIEDMGMIPEGKSSIDRYPNQSGNYEPGNCRWADSFGQSRNRRNNVLVTINGITMTATEASKKLGFSKDTLRRRIKDWGYTEEDALAMQKYERNKKKKI